MQRMNQCFKFGLFVSHGIRDRRSGRIISTNMLLSTFFLKNSSAIGQSLSGGVAAGAGTPVRQQVNQMRNTGRFISPEGARQSAPLDGRARRGPCKTGSLECGERVAEPIMPSVGQLA